jgi:hypothetical protein
MNTTRRLGRAPAKGIAMIVAKTYDGNCFCGAVLFRATGTPVAMGFCHCASCRHWSAGPVNAFTLWRPESLRVTRGSDNIAAHNRTPQSTRQWCRNCGGHLFTGHPPLGLVDIYAAVLPTLRFKPTLHVNYGEAVLRMPDGLPKQKDMPREMGGTGTLLPE